MMDWNVVICIHQDGFRRAARALREFGPVGRSPYHNVVVMAVDDPLALLDAVESQANLEPGLHEAISRVAPATQCFTFHSIEEFEDRAKAIGLGWLPRLANRSFHVRLHRRGFKHVLRSPDAERFLDDALLAALEQAGTPGRISFSDPDMIISLDTIDDRAGMALWSREELVRHPFLRPE